MARVNGVMESLVLLELRPGLMLCELPPNLVFQRKTTIQKNIRSKCYELNEAKIELFD